MAVTGNTVPTRIGANNLGSDKRELFLKVSSGEILATFDTKTVMKEKHRTRTINSGKTAQFPVSGIASAKYHVPGENILESNNAYLSQIKMSSREINIDSLLIAADVIDNLDEMIAHYDVRSEFAHKLGTALAEKYDRQVMQVLALAATATSTITSLGKNRDGTVLYKGTNVLTGSGMASAIFEAGVQMDLRDVPDSERYVLLDPATYAAVVQYLSTPGNLMPLGSYELGIAPKINNFLLVKTNLLPNAVVTAESGVNNTYDGDFTNVAALAFQKEALGTVQLMGLASEMEWKMEYQANFMLAKYALGHGILRPECACRIAKTLS